jgi:probable F420-dependent oxidoreductase
MKVDRAIVSMLAAAAADARAAEEAGYDGIFSFENAHDPFIPLALAASTTEHIELYTAIAVAFARTPMTMASSAWDVHSLSGGRLSLGLGSQVKAHIERRLSMPWSRPAARMREYVAALRAIWTSWQDGTRLDFRGDFYTHTLMPPLFNPGPCPFGLPRILVAGTGDLMVQVAAEAGDGLVIHPFTTERYIRDVILPTVERGLMTSARDRNDFELSCQVLVATGTNGEELERAKAEIRKEIAFFGSTPSWRSVLELHGWAELGTSLNGLAKEGRWADMAGLIDDEVLETFAVVGEPNTIASILSRRFDGLLDRVSLYTPYEVEKGVTQSIALAIRNG